MPRVEYQFKLWQAGLVLASSPGHSFGGGGGGGAGYEVRLVLASSRGHCFGGEWPGDEVRLVHACGASVGGELVT